MSNLLNHGDKFEQHSEGMNPCIFCGSEVKTETYFVEINYVNGSIWSDAEGECETSQGWFPVGNGCAKKFAAGVLAKVGA